MRTTLNCSSEDPHHLVIISSDTPPPPPSGTAPTYQPPPPFFARTHSHTTHTLPSLPAPPPSPGPYSASDGVLATIASACIFGITPPSVAYISLCLFTKFNPSNASLTTSSEK